MTSQTTSSSSTINQQQRSNRGGLLVPPPPLSTSSSSSSSSLMTATTDHVSPSTAEYTPSTTPFVPFNQQQQQPLLSQTSFATHGANYANSVANAARKGGGRYVQLTPAVQEEVGRRVKDKQGILGAVRGVVGSIPFLAPMLQRPSATNPGSPEQAAIGPRDLTEGPPKTPLHPPSHLAAGIAASKNPSRHDDMDTSNDEGMINDDSDEGGRGGDGEVEEMGGSISMEDWSSMSEQERKTYISWLESVADAKLKELQ
jgi:hypothetical protein